jgi:8-oxo-dGTP pyrophosphatase MutT (NUDIX family)
MNKIIYYHHKKLIVTCDIPQDKNTNYKILNAEKNPEKAEMLIDNFLSSEAGNDLLFLYSDLKSGLQQLKKHFHYIEAAGGLIKNKETFLFIKRLNKWDLPKGKIEKSEKPEEAAVRECEEEVGIKELSLKKELMPSYHIYPYKNSYALKKTFWFLMKSDFEGKLIPQTDEDIEAALWLSKNDITTVVLKNTYPAIIDVLKNGGAID